MAKLLIFGATSAIVQGTLQYFAADGDSFYLVARNPQKLQTVYDNLMAAGAKAVFQHTVDLNKVDQHSSIVEIAVKSLGNVDIVLIGHGVFSDQKTIETDYYAILDELHANMLSHISLLVPVANYMEQQRSGTIAVITSVAGDRGRRSNYIYGTAQGAKSIYLQGLRSRLASAGVTVLTIKPGFVDTPMAAHRKKNFLFASPSSVGKSIYRAIKSKKEVIYTPFFWRYIMYLIRAIPERIFKGTNF